jgi:hypothetical protein
MIGVGHYRILQTMAVTESNSRRMAGLLVSLVIGATAVRADWMPDPDAWLHEQVDRMPESVHLGGVFSAGYFEYDSRNTRDSGFRLERAVLRLDGRAGDTWAWRIAPDLRGVDTRHGLEEGWVSFMPSRRMRGRAGLVRVPLSIEHNTPPEYLSFVGYSFLPYLDGRTDVGLRLDGEFSDGLFSYDLAAVAGEGYDPNGQPREDPQYSARLVTYPLLHAPWLQGFFLMGGFAYSPSFEGEIDVASPFRNKLFDSIPIQADEAQFRHFGWGLDAGRVRLVHEFIKGSLLGVDRLDGTGQDDLDDEVNAWQATASWWLTGERYDSRPFRQEAGPPAPFPARSRGGAWELAARYSNGDIARELFRMGYTDFDVSSQEFRSISGALNWYARPDFRLTLQVVRLIADQTPQALGGQGRDTSWFAGGQWLF